MTQRILILTDPYGKPSFAPRLRYLCDYLVRKGYEIEVITEEFEPIPFAHPYPIETIRLYRGKADWVMKSLLSLLFDWKNRTFSRRVRQLTKNKRYDLVYCTTFSTFPLRAAAEVAREKQIPLHVDIRDLDEQVPGAQYQHHRGWWTRPFRTWYRAVNIRRRNRILRIADSISTISPWHVDFIRRLNPNVELVWNGYDPRRFYREDIQTDAFVIGYFGKTYPFQHPEIVEQIVREIPEVKLQFVSGLPNEQVADEIRRCSILLVLTNPTAHGMMTTKFYEAFGCEKPILCVPSDEGLLAQVIREKNAGLASGDKEEIQAFIQEKYAEWKQNGFTHQAVRDKEVFSRETEAEQMEKILRQHMQ